MVDALPEDVEVRAMTYQLFEGDCREVLKTLPEASVDMIMTSPPFYGLRKYKAPDVIFDGKPDCQHEWGDIEKPASSGGLIGYAVDGGIPSHDKSATHQKQHSQSCRHCGAWRGQLGLEPQPELFVRHLCDILDLCRPILKKTGTLWVNLADSYTGSGKNSNNHKPLSEKQFTNPYSAGIPTNNLGIPPKSLIGIPARFQIEMISRGWICRNILIWWKPNCMPASVKDRFTVDFEYLFMFSQQQRYYFEQQFEEQLASSIERCKYGWKGKPGDIYPAESREMVFKNFGVNPLGRNKRSVWSIPTSPSHGHYATFPAALCTTPILAGCPEFICSKCGKPRMKMYEHESHYTKREEAHAVNSEPSKVDYTGWESPTITCKGLNDCGCSAPFVPGVVLDPFAGTGTVGEEAIRLRRNAILIEISDQYTELVKKRLDNIQIEARLEV